MAADGLNARQQRFADLILEGRAGWRAYREAGYTARTDHAAGANAARLIASDRMARYLAQRRAAATERAEITVAETLHGLPEIAEDPRQPGMARVAAYKALLDAIKAGLVPLRLELPEATPLSHERVRGLAAAVLENAVAGRISVHEGESLLSLLFGAAQAVLAAEAIRPEPGLIEAEGEPGAPEPPPVAWFKPTRPG